MERAITGAESKWSAQPGSLNRCAARSLRSKFAVPVTGGHAAVHEEVATGDEPAVRAHSATAVHSASVPATSTAQVKGGMGQGGARGEDRLTQGDEEEQPPAGP